MLFNVERANLEAQTQSLPNLKGKGGISQSVKDSSGSEGSEDPGLGNILETAWTSMWLQHEVSAGQ